MRSITRTSSTFLKVVTSPSQELQPGDKLTRAAQVVYQVVHFYTLFTLQPPGPQHRPHDIFRPGEDQQQQPPIQEGQGILLY